MYLEVRSPFSNKQPDIYLEMNIKHCKSMSQDIGWYYYYYNMVYRMNKKKKTVGLCYENKDKKKTAISTKILCNA